MTWSRTRPSTRLVIVAMPITPADRASRRAGGRALCAVETLPASGSGPGAGVLMGWRQGYYSDQCAEDLRPEDAGRDRPSSSAAARLDRAGLQYQDHTYKKRGVVPVARRPQMEDGKRRGPLFPGLDGRSRRKNFQTLVRPAFPAPPRFR